MPTQWFCQINGQERGPFTASQLRRLVAEGELGPSDTVRKESMVEWVLAAGVKGLFADSPSSNNEQTTEQAWYVRVAGRQLGPFFCNQLIALIQQQLVRAEHYVQYGDSGPWQPVRDVKGLSKYAASASNPVRPVEPTDGLIRFDCPRCKRRLKCPKRHAGITAPCPKCQSPVVIPRDEPVRSANDTVVLDRVEYEPPTPDLPPEIAAATPSAKQSVPVRNPAARLWQRASNWATRATAALNKRGGDTRPSAPDKRPPPDRIEFFGPGMEVDLGFGLLQSPLIYATRKMVVESVEASLVELPRPVAGDKARFADPLPYWPTYREATPAQRACYLQWLSGGRSDPHAEIGYVFLYFYGLERRILVDRSDYEPVIRELIRLLSIYRTSRPFVRYAGALLWLSISLVSRRESITPDLVELAVQAMPKWTPESLRGCLAYFVERRMPLPASVAFVVAEHDERTPSSVVVTRHPDRFRRLFEERFGDHFADGLFLQPSQRAAKPVYQLGSPTLLRRGDLPALVDSTLPDALGVQSQFNPIVTLWSSCVDELRKFDRISRGIAKLEMTAEMYEALPPELRTDDHPEANAWQELMAGRVDASGWPIVSISDLATIKGFDYRAQLTKKQCQQMLVSADCIGLAIEPDARLTNKNYRWDEIVIVYHDELDHGAASLDAFLSASMLLRLGLTIAAADDNLDESELDVIAEHLEERFDLSKRQTKRLEALKHLLITHRAAAATVPSSLRRTLALPERRLIGQFLVGVAAADQWISEPEADALRRAYRALGLNEEELDRLLLPAAAPTPTRGHLAAQQSTTGHRMNLDRIRQIRAETVRVQDLLHQAMATDDLSVESAVESYEESATPQATTSIAVEQDVVAASESTSSNNEQCESVAKLYGIPARFRPFVAEMILRERWPVEDLRASSRRHGVMLSAAIEATNQWSQEHFEDWLIEDDGDAIRINMKLLCDA